MMVEVGLDKQPFDNINKRFNISVKTSLKADLSNVQTNLYKSEGS